MAAFPEWLYKAPSLPGEGRLYWIAYETCRLFPNKVPASCLIIARFPLGTAPFGTHWPWAVVVHVSGLSVRPAGISSSLASSSLVTPPRHCCPEQTLGKCCRSCGSSERLPGEQRKRRLLLSSWWEGGSSRGWGFRNDQGALHLCFLMVSRMLSATSVLPILQTSKPRVREFKGEWQVSRCAPVQASLRSKCSLCHTISQGRVRSLGKE